MGKITVTYENCMNEDGEDTSVSFSKSDVEFVEDYLYVMGRAGRAFGFDMITYLEAGSDDHDRKYQADF